VPGDVNQLGGLLLDGGNHFGMAVAGGGHGDARRKVEKLVAVHVFHADAAAALGHQRIRARVAGRDQPVVGLDGGLGLGSGQRTNELGSVLRVQFLLGHLLDLLDGFGCAACGIHSMPGRGSQRGGMVQFSSPCKGEIEQERIFGGADLVAAEEARSSEIGKYAQVSPRADAARARPRPAPGGRCKQSITFSLVLYS
jgi:hypothetical protein